MRGPAQALCLLLIVATGPAQAQDVDQSQQPVTTIKTYTRLVAISAVVKSKNGEIQQGLTKNDFVLKQDGKEQSIGYFSKGSDLPLSLALMVDTSDSQRTFIGDESLASDVFFETMLSGPQDRATLIQFGPSVVQLKPMTNSANALHLALSQLSSPGAVGGGTVLYDAVYHIARDVLAKETGRKAMVILSDGGDNGSRRLLEEAIEQAQRGDVQIYSILYSMRNLLSSNSSGIAPSLDTGREALQKLSEATGGRVFTVSANRSLREIFAEIGQDLRLQYELGYKPPAEDKPDTYHKLELKAKDKKLMVQARKGFFEPKE
jgi:VWFA-related protein